MLDVVYVLGGFLLLSFGAAWLVDGASRLALRFGVSQLVVGLTVVAFGTSAPELFVSVKAALGGQPHIAVGNVVGSSVFNVLLILGLSALIIPLEVQRRLTRYEVPALVFVTGLVWFFIHDGSLSVAEALVLCLGGVLYFSLTAWFSRTGAPTIETGGEPEADAPRPEAWWVSTARSAAGLVLLVAGSEVLVMGAANLALRWGMSELTVGIVIIAAGTSLPELATSLVAAMRGERDIAVGNVVGSNMFNLLAALGAAGAIGGPLSFPPEALQLDVPVMFGAAALCLPVVITGARISRFEGGLFLAAFGLYMTALILNATGHGMADDAMFLARWWVVPSVAVVLMASLIRSLREVDELLDRLGHRVDEAVAASAKRVKTAVVLVTGATLIAIGMALFLTPFPGVVVVALGLSVLAIEFAWAKRLLVRLRISLRKLADLRRKRPKAAD